MKTLNNKYRMNGSFEISDIARGIVQYEIVIPINAELSGTLNADMGYLVNKYGKLQPIVRPYITLVSFDAYEHLEPIVTKWMQRICSMLDSIKIEINNYGITPNGEMHYRIQNADAFGQFYKSFEVINSYLQDSGLPSAIIHKQPKLIIAEQVQSLPAMLEFSAREIHETMDVKGFWLIKKSTGNTDEKLNVFSLIP